MAGTSGWQYRDWRGAFYPPGVPQRRWLEHYAEQFATVENNGTFYRLPARDTFASWRDRVPADFVMAVKASRYLTHVRRLRDPAEPVRRLLDAAAGLGGRLGPVLLQLPPDLRADPRAAGGVPAPVPAGDAGRGRASAPIVVDRRGARGAVGGERRAVLGGPRRIRGHAAVADGRLGLPAVPRGRRRPVAELQRRHAERVGGADNRGRRRVRLLQQRPARRGAPRRGPAGRGRHRAAAGRPPALGPGGTREGKRRG